MKPEISCPSNDKLKRTCSDFSISIRAPRQSKVRPGIEQHSNPGLRISQTLAHHGLDTEAWKKLPVKQMADVVRLALKTDHFLLNPCCQYMQVWDLIVLVCMIFIVFITPFEVAFLQTTLFDPLFFINRIIDTVFIKDMVMNFFIVYRDTDEHGNLIWIMDRRKIALRYMSPLRGWFVIDVLSIIPYDLLALALDQPNDQLKLIRTLRLLRLMRLVKVLKSSRILFRIYHLMPMSHAKLNLLRSAIVLLGASHLMACLFGFVGKLAQEDHGSSWIESVNAKGAEHVRDDELLKQYLLALYWSIMTITSVGYGDITPQWLEEYMVVILCMLAGGCIWAYNIGNLCSVVSNLCKQDLAFQQQMDELTNMCESRRIPQGLRERLRTYLTQSRDLRQMEMHKNITSLMSPALQGEVFHCASQGWLLNIWCFKGLETNFVVALAKSLDHALFPPKEEILSEEPAMFIVERGAVHLQGNCTGNNFQCGANRVVAGGHCFHEDHVLIGSEHWLEISTKSLNFCSVFVLCKSTVDKQREMFPKANEHLHKQSLKLLFMRNLKQAAYKQQEQEKIQEKGKSGSTGWPNGESECVTNNEGQSIQQAIITEDTVFAPSDIPLSCHGDIGDGSGKKLGGVFMSEEQQTLSTSTSEDGARNCRSSSASESEYNMQKTPEDVACRLAALETKVETGLTGVQLAISNLQSQQDRILKLLEKRSSKSTTI